MSTPKQLQRKYLKQYHNPKKQQKIKISKQTNRINEANTKYPNKKQYSNTIIQTHQTIPNQNKQSKQTLKQANNRSCNKQISNKKQTKTTNLKQNQTFARNLKRKRKFPHRHKPLTSTKTSIKT